MKKNIKIYNNLKHINIDKAKRIADCLKDKFVWLEELENQLYEIDGELYSIEYIEETKRYSHNYTEYATEVGLICKCDKNLNVLERYNVAVINNITVQEIDDDFFVDFVYKNHVELKKLYFKRYKRRTLICG